MGKEYIAMAQSLNEKGLNVFISAHRVVLEYLLTNHIEFHLLAPAENKSAWKSRLELDIIKILLYQI